MSETERLRKEAAQSYKRIAELEAENRQLEEDRLLDVDQGYYRKLEARIAELEAALAAKQDTLDDLAKTTREYIKYTEADVFHTEWRRAEAALADESARVEEFRSTLEETCKQRDAILERADQAEAALALSREQTEYANDALMAMQESRDRALSDMT